MLFWSIAIAATAIACVALFYAAVPRMVNAAAPETDDANSHFRQVLTGIDADLASGKLGEAEATAAKAELAREILRHKAEAGTGATGGPAFGKVPHLVGVAAVAVMTLGLYAVLGSPDVPSMPLASRENPAASQIDLDAAIVRIEEQLAANPDDVRGWSVIAPAYLQLGRYADAAKAFRRVIELGEATPEVQLRLAEALLREGSEASASQAVSTLETLVASDDANVMAKLYLASVYTGLERYDDAVTLWEAAIATANGDEPWLANARQGLAVAQNAGAPQANEAETEMIGQMVTGLAERLSTSGGSIEEWTQLVRAYLVLGDTDSAQAAYGDAVAAYPQAFDRGDLDTLALGAGLTLNGAPQ
jgi:cytochrome c-type biogenesis protein CcmH